MLKPDLLPSPLEVSAPTHVVCPDLEETFQQVQKPDVNLAVCQRAADEAIVSFIQRVYRFSFQPVSLVVNEGRVKEQLSEALADYLPLHNQGAFRLIEDMATLADLFMKLTRQSRTSLLLQTVENDACRKFHTDAYRVRLICTYDGPGTQWLPNDQVNRAALGTTNEQIAKDPGKVQDMGRFYVGIMRGDHPTHQTSHGIVHRSPPIKAQGLKRFVFRLDC